MKVLPTTNSPALVAAEISSPRRDGGSSGSQRHLAPESLGRSADGHRAPRRSRPLQNHSRLRFLDDFFPLMKIFLRPDTRHCGYSRSVTHSRLSGPWPEPAGGRGRSRALRRLPNGSPSGHSFSRRRVSSEVSRGCGCQPKVVARPTHALTAYYTRGRLSLCTPSRSRVERISRVEAEQPNSRAAPKGCFL